MANYSKGRAAYPEWTGAEQAALKRLYPIASWGEIYAAVPGRSRAALNQYARKILKLRRDCDRRDRWSDKETVILMRLWPMADDAELLAALPGRQLTFMSKKASALKIRRFAPATRKSQRFVDPIFVQLRKERDNRKLTRPKLAAKIGYHYNQILAWELGKAIPSFRCLQDWANALGFDVILREKLSEEKLAAIVIPYPDRKKMMGGRS